MDADIFAPGTLRQYALIADGERGALIGPRGNIAFLCAPRWHDDAVFSCLVGGAGGYARHPADDRFVWGGHYEPDSLIWRSRWVTTDAITECREALAFPGEPERRGAAPAHRGDRGGARSRWCWTRGRVRAESGPAAPEGTGTAGRATGLPVDRGARHARSGRPWRSTLSCRVGASRDLVLEISDRPTTTVPTRPGWAATEAGWRRACPTARLVAPGDVATPTPCSAA